MRRTLLRVAALTLGLAAVGGPGGGAPSPENPHAYMDDEKRCGGCHHVEKDGDDWILDPHIFRISVSDICRVCHPTQQTGRSHPVGKDPLRVLQMKQMPAGLPLQAVDGEREELMTCGTCHNPHMPRLLRQRLFPRQPVFPGRRDEYLSYFLRVRSPDGREGFTTLCRACHPKL